MSQYRSDEAVPQLARRLMRERLQWPNSRDQTAETMYQIEIGAAKAELNIVMEAVEVAAAMVPTGEGSEHYRHGRETMRDDILKALRELRQA